MGQADLGKNRLVAEPGWPRRIEWAYAIIVYESSNRGTRGTTTALSDTETGAGVRMSDESSRYSAERSGERKEERKEGKSSNKDITPLLKGWDYEPGTINVRKIN